MMDWFRNLAPRERNILVLGALAAAVIIGWGFVWTPLSERHAELVEQVDEKSRLLVDLVRAGAVPASGGAVVQGAQRNQSILLVIDNAARTFGLADSFSQTRPNGPDEISVSFQRAPFDTVVAWLIDLEATYGITVSSASISDSGQPGLVNGQIFLARS